MKHFLGLMLVVVVIAQAGCGRSHESEEGNLPEIDRSLLTGLPCAAPCWSEIMPGETNSAEVYLRLAMSPWVRKGSPTWLPQEWSGAAGDQIVWDDADIEQGANRATFVDDRLVLLQIGLDYDGLTLGSILTIYGPPEAVYAYAMLESYEYGVHFHYPSVGMSFQSIAFPVGADDVLLNPNTGILAPDMPVDWANYYEPASLENVLRNAFGMSEERTERMLSDMQLWQGFGQVKLCCQ